MESFLLRNERAAVVCQVVPLPEPQPSRSDRQQKFLPGRPRRNEMEQGGDQCLIVDFNRCRLVGSQLLRQTNTSLLGH